MFVVEKRLMLNCERLKLEFAAGIMLMRMEPPRTSTGPAEVMAAKSSVQPPLEKLNCGASIFPYGLPGDNVSTGWALTPLKSDAARMRWTVVKGKFGYGKSPLPKR